MKFLDEAKVYISSGSGGPGCISFRREANVPKGGPDGGNGGNGGNVYAIAVNNLNTLIDYRYRQHFRAKNGSPGMGKNRNGKSGEHLVLKVPVGTQIFCENKMELLADLNLAGEQVLLAKSGHGGRGNSVFKSSTNQSPRKFEKGQPGEDFWIWLRLKLIADIGIIGLPNAGKSTFISSVTGAKPKIADYPFTTIVPQMGVASYDNSEIVLADIPGLIAGANLGTGLGTRFLGHIERCSVLLHIIDGTNDNISESYLTVRQELTKYGAGLDEKHEIIAINKSDLISQETMNKHIYSLSKSTDNHILLLSAITGQGSQTILKKLAESVKKSRVI